MNLLNPDLLPTDQKFIVAVSGGRDSVGLFFRLLQIRDHLADFALVHVNHQMRPESGRDGEFVAQLAQDHKVPFFMKALDPIPQTETQARHGRYQAFIEVAQEYDAQSVMVAHHRQDQLETRLMNLIRGSSPSGLLGMPAKRLLTDQISLLRPALDCDPGWLHKLAPNWNEDTSNQIPNTLRNRLRLEIIPDLNKLLPRELADSFESLANLLHEDLEVLRAMVPQEKVLSRQRFLALPKAIQRRWLRSLAALESNQIQRGLEAVNQISSIDLGQGVRLEVGAQTVTLKSR